MKKTTPYRIAAALLITLFAQKASAQDTLQFRNGKEAIGKVTEITSTLVKYKKSDDGPLYSEFKNDLAMVKYNNGSSEKFEFKLPEAPIVVKREVKSNPKLEALGSKYMWGKEIISNREMHQMLLNTKDKEISQCITEAKQQARGQYIGFLAIPCIAIGAGLLAATAEGGMDQAEGLSSAGVVSAIGIACFATSITLKVKRTRNEAKAVRLYQQKY